MDTCKRHGKKWTHNEVLALQREHELLELDLQTIANKHKRSVKSIIHKLYAEGFTESLLCEDKVEVENLDELNINTLTDRVWNLETSLTNITSMVKEMFHQMTSKKEKSLIKS